MLRNKFFYEVITKYNFFNDFDVKSKLLFLFNNIDPFICKSVAAFIFEIMNCRHDHVISKVTNPLIIIIYFFKRIGIAMYVNGNIPLINCCCCCCCWQVEGLGYSFPRLKLPITLIYIFGEYKIVTHAVSLGQNLTLK